LVCLDLQNGRLIWQRDTARDWNIPEAFFGVGSTPLLEGDRLIVMVGAQPNAGVVALQADTGRTDAVADCALAHHGRTVPQRRNPRSTGERRCRR
jgi:hypothetical protein